jgi:hypothetical protein
MKKTECPKFAAKQLIVWDTGHFNAVRHLIVAGEILRAFGVVNSE